MALWFQTALVGGRWASRVRIAHAGGRITSVECDVEPAADDERGGAAVPGLGDVHSHAFQRGMAGLAERRGETGVGDSFWTWRAAMYRFVDRIGPAEAQAIAAMAYAEMLESGFTRVGEFHYLHHAPDGRAYDDVGEMAGAVAAAAGESGIGLTLLPVFYAHGGFGEAPAGPAQRRFLSTPEIFSRLLERARTAAAGLEGGVVGVAPHSLRAATMAQIAAIVPLAQGGPVHIHVAEQVREVEDCRAVHGTGPLALLLDGAEVDARWCLVHATHATAPELARLAARGAVVGLCPITEANLGDGVFPAADFQAIGGRLGIGSDSNVLIDAAEELRMLEYGQRLTRRGRNLLAGAGRPSTGASLYLAALAGGAQALGVPAADLAPGAAADLVSLDLAHPALAGRDGDALLDGWIFAARGGAVDGVWRAGVKRVSGGRHHDREAIAARFCGVIRRVLAA
jgi:formimidoylglutamate deiminase